MQRSFQSLQCLMRLFIIMAFLWGNPALAAFPIPEEEFHVRVSEIQDSVLQDAIGVFDLIVPGEVREISRPFTPPAIRLLLAGDIDIFILSSSAFPPMRVQTERLRKAATCCWRI